MSEESRKVAGRLDHYKNGRFVSSFGDWFDVLKNKLYEDKKEDIRKAVEVSGFTAKEVLYSFFVPEFQLRDVGDWREGSCNVSSLTSWVCDKLKNDGIKTNMARKLEDARIRKIGKKMQGELFPVGKSEENGVKVSHVRFKRVGGREITRLEYSADFCLRKVVPEIWKTAFSVRDFQAVYIKYLSSDCKLVSSFNTVITKMMELSAKKPHEYGGVVVRGKKSREIRFFKEEVVNNKELEEKKRNDMYELELSALNRKYGK